MDMLLLADATGVVDMTPEAISRRTGIRLRDVNSGISALCQPDERSRSEAEEGRRLVLVDSHRDWGWKITNYDHYRNLRTNGDRTEYFRDYNRSRPPANNRRINKSTQVTQPTTQTTHENTHAEAEADAELKTKTTPRAQKKRLSEDRPSVDIVDSTRTARVEVAMVSHFHEFWSVYREIRGVGEDQAARVWISLDCDSQVEQVVPCLASYAASRDVQNGAVMSGERWLADNARDHWRSRWPPARASGTTKTDETNAAIDRVLMREAKRGAHHP